MSDQFLLVCCSCICRICPSQVQRPHSLSRTLNGVQVSKPPIEKARLNLQTEDHLNNIYSSYLRTFTLNAASLIQIRRVSQTCNYSRYIPAHRAVSLSVTLDFRCRYWNRQFQRLCGSIIESVQKCRGTIIINVYCQNRSP